jgi:hypothetical protein
MAACGWCQSTIQTNWWLTVSQWAGNCTSVQYDTTGIPDSVSTSTINIPQWALAIPTGTSWNPSQASNIALPSGLTTDSTSGFSTSRTSSYSYSTPTYPYGPFYDYGASVNVAAIVCGVIFGLWALVLIGVVAAYFIRQNKRKAWYGPMARYYQGQRNFGGQPGYGKLLSLYIFFSFLTSRRTKFPRRLCTQHDGRCWCPTPLQPQRRL